MHTQAAVNCGQPAETYECEMFDCLLSLQAQLESPTLINWQVK